MQVYTCTKVVPSSLDALPWHILRVSIVAPFGRSIRVEIIRLWKKRKEQSNINNSLVLRQLSKQDPLILAGYSMKYKLLTEQAFQQS